jgi:acyl-CoA thioesterase FadM
MPLTDKVELGIPESESQFQSQYRVGIQEINYAKHLSNDRYLALADELFMRFLQLFDQGESDQFFGYASIIAAAKVQFTGQAFYGDELDLKLWITERSNSGFRVLSQFTCNDREIGRVQVDRIFFDYTLQKIVPCPEAFITYFDSLPN